MPICGSGLPRQDYFRLEENDGASSGVTPQGVLGLQPHPLTLGRTENGIATIRMQQKGTGPTAWLWRACTWWESCCLTSVIAWFAS